MMVGASLYPILAYLASFVLARYNLLIVFLSPFKDVIKDTHIY